MVVTPGTIQTVAVWIVSIWAAIEVFTKIKSLVKRPNMTQDERLDGLEARVKVVETSLIEINEKLSRDYRRMNDLERSIRLNMRGHMALLNHAIDGNNKDEMIEVRNKFRDVIYESKEKIKEHEN